MTHVGGQHVLPRAACHGAHPQPSRRGIVQVLGGDDRDVAAVWTPRDGSELAGIVEVRFDPPALDVDDVNAAAHEVVVDERRRREDHRQPAAVGAPQREHGRSRQIEHTAGLLVVYLRDDDLRVLEVLLEDLLREALLLQLLDLLRHLRRGQEGDALAVGAPVVAADVGVVADDAASLAAGDWNQVDASRLVVAALRKKRETRAIRRPQRLRDRVAADEGRVLASGDVDAVQLGPGRAVGLVHRVAGHREQIRDARSIGRRRDRRDRADPRDVPRRQDVIGDRRLRGKEESRHNGERHMGPGSKKPAHGIRPFVDGRASALP